MIETASDSENTKQSQLNVLLLSDPVRKKKLMAEKFCETAKVTSNRGDEGGNTCSLLDGIYGRPPVSTMQDSRVSQTGSVKSAMQLYRTRSNEATGENKSDENQVSEDSATRSRSSDVVTGRNTDLNTNRSLVPTKSPALTIGDGTQNKFSNNKLWTGQTSPFVIGAPAQETQHSQHADAQHKQFKCGPATVADFSMVAGGALMLMHRAPKIGPTLFLRGMNVRSFYDLIPNKLEK